MKSQTKQIEEWLDKGGAISAIKALEMFGCFRLAARISEIRERKTVYGKMVEHGGKRFKLYYGPNSNHVNIYGKVYK